MTSFRDDYPGGQELPPRMQLYKVVEQRFVEAQAQFFATIAQKLGVTEAQYHDAAHAAGVTGQTVFYTNLRQPIQFGPAEAMEARSITGIDRTDSGDRGFASVAFNLFSDGSPFLFEPDIDEVEAVSSYDRSYTLYVSSEHPPYIAASARIGEGEQVDHTGLKGTSEAYLLQAQAEGISVHFINDDEAESIINMLSSAAVDVEHTLSIREPDLDAVRERLVQ